MDKTDMEMLFSSCHLTLARNRAGQTLAQRPHSAHHRKFSHLRNYLLYVEWDVKPYTHTRSSMHLKRVVMAFWTCEADGLRTAFFVLFTNILRTYFLQAW